MPLRETVLQAIGRTPLIPLHRLQPVGGARILVKCEYLNPAGSIKDRMALHIIEQAEREGLLRPGGTIVENTSGNTGAGLALIAAIKGYKVIFTMPDKMSQEKVDLLRAYGAKVVITPTNVPADSPDSYYETAKRIARETPGAFYVNQYHNKSNIDAHFRSTGPELWEDVGGRLDVLVAGMGTGGTISGVGRFLKQQDANIKVVGVDPVGSLYHSLFKTGQPSQPHVYKVEGIGEDMICGALDMSVIDDVRQVTDKECFRMARRLAREEGILAGGSSGGAVHVARQLALELGPDKVVAVMLPDSGNRYLSKMYNDEWMRLNGFLEDDGEAVLRVSDLLARKALPLITVQGTDSLRSVVELLKRNDISQVPVLDGDRLVGLVSESHILRHVLTDFARLEGPVGEIANPRVPVVEPTLAVSRLSEYMLGADAVLVRAGTAPQPDRLLGILTRIDLMETMLGE